MIRETALENHAVEQESALPSKDLRPQQKIPAKKAKPLRRSAALEHDLPYPPKPKSRKGRLKEEIPEGPYNNPQLDLFQSFVCNTEFEQERLSNTIDIWDSVPRYSISRLEMTKRRDEKGNLPPLSVKFMYRSQTYAADIYPAMIKDGDKFSSYYPSANEELVEDALRKIAARKNGGGFFEKETVRSGVAFSLYELRKELAERGHTRSYKELTLSLSILQMSHIKIKLEDNNGESFIAANYLPALAAVSRKQLADDPAAKWVAQFHPLVARCVDQVTYRQFNYVTMMGLPSQLSRWIHKQLSIKFTFASFLGNPFEMRYSTIKRDSNLLNCGQERNNRCEVDKAFKRLIESQVLREVKQQTITAAKGKVVDVIYQLYPTHEFVKEMKASNKRSSSAPLELQLKLKQISK